MEQKKMEQDGTEKDITIYHSLPYTLVRNLIFCKPNN